MGKTIGFIGCGNMATAMIGGIISSGLVDGKSIIGSATSDKTLGRMEEEFAIRTTKDNRLLAGQADIIFLAVKPHLYGGIIQEIKDHVKEGVIIIIIAAGKTIAMVEDGFESNIKVVRTMPNTPAMVGEGMTAITFNSFMGEDDRAYVLDLFESFGKVEIVEENLYHGVTSISGSSPAYVYMFIEALADGGVLEGLPRDKAYKFAAQAVLGSAKMVLESGTHPGKLKDDVCSPGGTTIEAVGKLEEEGFRNAVIKAVKTCADKSRQMSN